MSGQQRAVSSERSVEHRSQGDDGPQWGRNDRETPRETPQGRILAAIEPAGQVVGINQVALGLASRGDGPWRWSWCQPAAATMAALSVHMALVGMKTW